MAKEEVYGGSVRGVFGGVFFFHSHGVTEARDEPFGFLLMWLVCVTT